MINEQSLTHFFSVLREKKKSFDENYKFFAPKLAPKFSIFNFVRRDENALSNIISNLLDPHGDHEQGSTFLKLFVEMLDKKLGAGNNLHLSNLGTSIENAKCVTESTTSQIINNQRRIDLVVHFGQFGIGIENKPWAFDQKNQLLDYSKELQRRYPIERKNDFLLVYLTGSDWEVSEYTIPNENLTELKKYYRFIQITFADIKIWLIECEAKCQADRVRNFLRDFVEYCEKEFGNGETMADQNLVKDYLLNNPENISLAFQVEKALPQLRNEVLEKLVKQIKEKFSKSPNDWIIETDTRFGYGSQNNTFIHFKKPNWSKHQITIMEYYGWCYGIRKQAIENNYLTNAEILEFENALNCNITKYGKGWVSSFLAYFDEPYRTWDINSVEFAKVASGNLDLCEKIYEAVISLEMVIISKNVQM